MKDDGVLLLDNHDDFSGHARRNEFSNESLNELSAAGAIRIGYGGTESIDTPSAYSDVARQVIRDIGMG
jgi:spermidine dehydrogenase